MSDKTVIVVDSTQIGHYLECPQLWNYSDLQRLEPLVPSPDGQLVKIEEQRKPLTIGTYGHKLMEIYYDSIAQGIKKASALECAIAFDPTKVCMCKHTKNQHYPNQFYPNKDVCNICDTCLEYKEVPSPLDPPTIKMVQERFRLYTYTYINNDIMPIEAEIGFSSPVYESESHLYVLEGRIDLVGLYSGQNCLMDHKFQERAHNLYKKSIQFRNYALVSNQLLLIINYVRFAKEVNKDTFRRDVVSFSRTELEVWRQRLIQVFNQIERTLKYNTFEQRWSACTGKYNQPCKYTSLCEEWNKDIIDAKIKTLYWQREEWKPW